MTSIERPEAGELMDELEDGVEVVGGATKYMEDPMMIAASTMAAAAYLTVLVPADNRFRCSSMSTGDKLTDLNALSIPLKKVSAVQEVDGAHIAASPAAHM
jgi:hypothetical protein